ncbi:metallophosphoesterase family protein [Siminovitchia fortis]|uniref:metallophosphoesterase family protein n=1 Tax=Siminovitchia fortis TaxID=254758 RepID=UPI001FCF99A5|nr:DNA repair exonuclease [Siminovitchia fortis]
MKRDMAVITIFRYNDRNVYSLEVMVLEEIRFIHTADLHLDSPFLGLSQLPEKLFSRLQESTFSAFERVVDTAIEKDVDFVLLAGDLFDGEDRSIKAQARLRKQLQRLAENNIFAFITYGNHDHMGGDWVRLDMPENVHVFSEKPEPFLFTAKNGVTVHVYGFSYPKRHVLTRKIDEYEKVPGADLHIAMLHGSEEGQSGAHQPYAPFTTRELLRKGMDYWALGHIHKRKILHPDPYIVYPGNTQGRHRKEEGEKGCYLVTMTKEGQTELEFIETADVRWETLCIDLKETTGMTELYTSCTAAMESLGNMGQSVLCQVIIASPQHLSQKVLKTIENGEFIEMLQDEAFLDADFVWPYRVEVGEDPLDEQKLISDDTFLAVLEEAANELGRTDEFDQAVSGLFSHTYASRYLDGLDERQREQLLHSAKKLVIRRLSEID